ncbi:4'-phosphopantetheinyl transferase, partial [Amylostereum chailletii]
GVGIDLISTQRMQRLVARRSHLRVASRILSPKEYILFKALPEDAARQTRFLAVRWAVKEAAFKALYPLAKPTWKELSYLVPEGCAHKPELSYISSHSNIKVKLLASISHDG